MIILLMLISIYVVHGSRTEEEINQKWKDYKVTTSCGILFV
jgi:hypothetical protein